MTGHRPLKAVGFDLWETLITDTPELSRQQERLRITRMEAILTARGHAAEAAMIERAHRALWHRCIELYWSDDRDIPCRRQIEPARRRSDLWRKGPKERLGILLGHLRARARGLRMPIAQRPAPIGQLGEDGHAVGALRMASSVSAMC